MGYNRTLGHFTNSQELATVWASGQNYIVNQLVLNNNKLYRCITAHTSGATFAGDSANWAGLNPGATVAISEGGTGQTTKTDAFDALSPTTTAGDLIVYNGTDNVRLPVGTDGQMIVADASQANKLKWATVPQGSKNYITYSNFENNATTGWSLFNTTLTSKIPTGSISAGAASLNALAVTAVTPLAGLYSLSVTSPAAVSAGQGFITSALPIDREDQAKVLTFSFYYEVISGGSNMNFSGTSSNTWAVYIAEVNPATPDTVINWIQPAGVYGMTQSTGAGLVTGTFQTSSTGTAYRVAVVCVTASAGAISMEFDDFKLGPQTAPIGPVVTDWVDYTPTGTWTSGVTYTGKWRRIGDSLEIQALLTCTSTVTATTLEVRIPTGLTIDSSKALLGNSTDFSYGRGTAFDNVGTLYHLNVGIGSSNSLFVRALNTSFTYASHADVNNNVPFTFNNGDFVRIEARVPISGWSSQVQLSSDTDTRVVAFSAYDGGSVSVTNTTAILPMGNTEVDTHSVRSGNTYVVPVSGFYRLAAKSTSRFSVGNVTFNHALLFYKNGVVQNNGDYGNADGANSAGVEFFFLSINSIVRLNAGDVIDFRYFTNYTGTATTYLKYCSIERLSGSSVVASSETVAMRAVKNAGAQTANATTQTVASWTSVVQDTHGIFNPTTGVAIIPVSGTYLCTFQVQFVVNATGSRVAQLYKNGSTQVAESNIYLTWSDRPVMNGSALLKLVAGDTLSVAAFQNSGGNLNYSTFDVTSTNFNIVRVGN